MIFVIFAVAMGEQSLIRQRNIDLQGVYTRLIGVTSNIQYLSRSTILSIMQEQAAPRFYLTPYQASLYILRGMKGGNVGYRKQAMIADLIENYERLRREYPEATKTALYEMVVEQPAKSFYLSRKRMREIIFNYRGR